MYVHWEGDFVAAWWQSPLTASVAAPAREHRPARPGSSRRDVRCHASWWPPALGDLQSIPRPMQETWVRACGCSTGCLARALPEGWQRSAPGDGWGAPKQQPCSWKACRRGESRPGAKTGPLKTHAGTERARSAGLAKHPRTIFRAV